MVSILVTIMYDPVKKGTLQLVPEIKELESVMCDVIKIRLKRWIETRSGKGNQPLNIKTAVEWPILKLRLPNLRWSFYLILFLVASLLYRRIFMRSHMTLSSASQKYRMSI